MALDEPKEFTGNSNPFIGSYRKPVPKGDIYTGPANKPMPITRPTAKDFLYSAWENGMFNHPIGSQSSEQVIGRPDAQNTAQRSKSISSGLKDAYSAVTDGGSLISPEQQQMNEMGEYEKFQKKWSNVRGNPFTGEKRDAFEALLNKKELTPKQQAVYLKNKNEFDAIMGNIEASKKPFGDLMSLGPRSLMPIGKSETTGQLGQSSSTANVASQYEVAYDKSGNPFRQERKSATMLPANVSRFETLGFGVPKGYSTSTQTPLNLPMTQGQLDKKLSDEESARAKAIIESHK